MRIFAANWTAANEFVLSLFWTDSAGSCGPTKRRRTLQTEPHLDARTALPTGGAGFGYAEFSTPVGPPTNRSQQLRTEADVARDKTISLNSYKEDGLPWRPPSATCHLSRNVCPVRGNVSRHRLLLPVKWSEVLPGTRRVHHMGRVASRRALGHPR